VCAFSFWIAISVHLIWVGPFPNTSLSCMACRQPAT